MKKFFPALKYINVPNMITTLGLILVMLACYFIGEENLKSVFICLFFASCMDLLDGFFANKLNQKTVFGLHLDTLTDFFSCCILPIFVFLVFVGNSPLNIVASSFYCVCGVWRLANYNISTGEKHNYFTGLPVPAAMSFVMLSLWLVINSVVPVWTSLIVLFVTGVLMISSIKLVKYALWQKVLGIGAVVFIIIVIIS